MKILFGYPAKEGYNNRTGLTNLRIQHIERLVKEGFQLKPFNMSYNSNFPVLSFEELDKKWKWKDKHLMNLYEEFLKEIEDCDVFYNSVGINFHPEFIESIPQFTVFGCNDDPESSNTLSKPVASSYDMCAIGNIAEIDTYKTWGVKNVVWQPMGFSPNMYDKELTYDKILNEERDIDLSMVIDKLSRYRRKRMEVIDKAFPDAHFYGRGWKRGYLPMGEEVNLLQRTRVGLNIHNSTGPINTRLFYLPANGVMQICDNKDQLGKVYELGKEVIGFDNVNEAIDLCHYYLNHDEERRIIAANGWKRVVKDYNEISVFQRLVDQIQIYKKGENKKCGKTSPIYLKPSTSDKINSFVYNNYEITKKILKKTGVKLYRSLQKQ